MSRDTVQILIIAATWAGGVGVAGGLLLWAMRRRSLAVQVIGVAAVAIASVIAGMIGTAREMFLSEHDFTVVVWVCLAAGVVGLIVAAGVGGAYVVWSRSLRDGAKAFGESGRFVASDRGPAELRALSEELSRTSEKLAEAQASQARLEGARRELVSWVSHDLRTPLAGMRAMAEALEDGMVADPGRYHRQIRVEADRMARQVDDLFELSRIHAGVLNLVPQPLALGDLISEALAAADPVARARGIRLGGTVEEGIQVVADPGALSRVLSNLVVNAIRHTPADGAVEIRGHPVEAGIEVSVSDGCGGIPEAEMERVFEVAWQGVRARTPDSETDLHPRGGGLGLAIVRGIVEAHRGTVAVENHGTGCRFRVLLPA
ncbi:MAG: HAMP domain-containing sensor histidine kinase [Nocardioides sp.]